MKRFALLAALLAGLPAFAGETEMRDCAAVGELPAFLNEAPFPLCDGDSDPVRVDLRTGQMRTAAGTEELTYSSDYLKDATSGTSVDITVNGEPFATGLTDAGTVAWTPAVYGTNEICHVVKAGEETVTNMLATFFVLSVEARPQAVAHAESKVYVDGEELEGPSYIITTNAAATVVYTAEPGYYFSVDGATALTNALDTTRNPAVNATPSAPFRPEFLLTLGDFNFGSMTFPRAEGLDVGSYKQLTIMLSREMSGESLSLPSVSGYSLNTTLSTDYSYVIDIAEPGKTAAEVGAYIRQIVFNGCRDQRIRFILSEEKSVYRTFYFDANRHYYQYVPFASANAFGWTSCYTKARNMWYMGRQGYLATVMSQPEDIFIYKASADPATGKGRVGWMGGTSCKHGDEDGDLYYASFDKSQADKSGDGHWYWACGPERGQEFFDWAAQATSCNTTIYTRNAVDNQYYFNWDSLASSGQREPNCTSQTGGYERFLTTLGFGYGYTTDPLSKVEGSKLASNVYGWNDLKENGNVGGASKWDVLGYVVEFGDQTTGDATEGSFVPGYVMVERDIRAPVVTYDAGEGTFPDGETTNAVTVLYAADGYVLPAKAPTLEGWSLVGWYLDPDNRSSFVMAGSPLVSQEDHTVYAVWELGGRTNVEVVVNGKKTNMNLSEEKLQSRGGDPEKIEENRNRLWENLVMGLEANGHVATGARQHPNEHKLTAVALNLDVPPANSGITVRYHLDRVSRDGRTRRDQESEADSPNGLEIDLDRIETNEYFKVRIVLSQTNETGEVLINKEFVATNTLGVLNVSQAPSKTIVSVPWGDLGIGDADVKVADLVKTANLTVGDKLYTYRTDTDREFPYDVWVLGSDYQWTPATQVNIGAENQAELAAVGSSSEETIPRGSACWLERQDPSRPIYLYGQVETNNTVRSTILANASGKPCWNLVGSPRVTPLDLNVQFPDGCDDDRIIVPTGGAPKNYSYKNGQWGYYTTVPYKKGVKSVFKTDDTLIPPGLGIWYINFGKTEKTIEWK